MKLVFREYHELKRNKSYFDNVLNVFNIKKLSSRKMLFNFELFFHFPKILNGKVSVTGIS